MTFSNGAAPGPPPHPTFLHPFLAATLGTKKGKKQQCDEYQQLHLQTARGRVFVPSVPFVMLLTLYFPCCPLNQMEAITRSLAT